MRVLASLFAAIFKPTLLTFVTFVSCGPKASFNFQVLWVGELPALNQPTDNLMHTWIHT